MKTILMPLVATALFLINGTAFAGLVFDSPVVAVDCAAGQSEVKADIPFRVEGDKVISVTKIATSCNCTTGEADAAQYTPGARGKIKLTFTVGERVGFQRKTIMVKTSDGAEQVAFFQTTVPVILEMQPAFVFWKKGDAPSAKEIQIRVALDQPVQVLAAAVSSPEAFTAELKTVEPGKRYILRLTPQSTAQPVTTRIVLKTDFSKDDTERFVVVAAVK